MAVKCVFVRVSLLQDVGFTPCVALDFKELKIPKCGSLKRLDVHYAPPCPLSSIYVLQRASGTARNLIERRKKLNM